MLKRKAKQSSRLAKFAKDVDNLFDDILDTLLDFSWSCNKKKLSGYGLWKKTENFCPSG